VLYAAHSAVVLLFALVLAGGIFLLYQLALSLSGYVM